MWRTLFVRACGATHTNARPRPCTHVHTLSVGNLVFTALMMSSAVVALHGACRVPDDLFLDESEVGGMALIMQRK